MVSDSYDGFKVGVPTGWDVSSLQGLVGVTANAAGREGALLYPALLTRGVTTQSLFSSFMTYEQHLLSEQGEALTYTERPGAVPAAWFEVRGSGAVLSGHATVLVLPQRTAVTTQVGVAFAYWAPQAQLSAVGPRWPRSGAVTSQNGPICSSSSEMSARSRSPCHQVGAYRASAKTTSS